MADQAEEDSGSNTVYSHDDLMELLDHIDSQRKQAVSLYKANPAPSSPYQQPKQGEMNRTTDYNTSPLQNQRVNSIPGAPGQNRIDLSNTDWSRRYIRSGVQPGQTEYKPTPPTYVPGGQGQDANSANPALNTAKAWAAAYHKAHPQATEKEIFELAKVAKEAGIFGDNTAFEQRKQLLEMRDKDAMARIEARPDIAGKSEEAKQKADTEAAAGKRSEEEIGKARGAAEVDYAKIQAGMPQLKKTIGALSALAPVANYTVAQDVVATAKRQLGLPVGQGAVAAAQYEGIINNVLLPSLRQMFGARVTNFDIQTAKNILGNPKLSPSEKEVQLNSFLQQKQEQVKTEYQTVKNLGGNPSPAMQEETAAPSGGAVDYTEYFK